MARTLVDNALSTIKEEATQRFASDLGAVSMVLLKRLFMILLRLSWGRTHYTHGIEVGNACLATTFSVGVRKKEEDFKKGNPNISIWFDGYDHSSFPYTNE
jgi:hypothetical protein